MAWRISQRRRNLAGQSDIYLVKALKDYRSGARKDDMMSLVAPALKDQDIDDLAAYYLGDRGQRRATTQIASCNRTNCSRGRLGDEDRQAPGTPPPKLPNDAQKHPFRKRMKHIRSASDCRVGLCDGTNPAWFNEYTTRLHSRMRDRYRRW